MGSINCRRQSWVGGGEGVSYELIVPSVADKSGSISLTENRHDKSVDDGFYVLQWQNIFIPFDLRFETLHLSFQPPRKF